LDNDYQSILNSVVLFIDYKITEKEKEKNIQSYVLEKFFSVNSSFIICVMNSLLL